MATKKSTKKTTKATPKKKAAPKKDRTMAKEPAGDRRKKLVQLLKKMKANSKSPKPLAEVAKRLGYSEFDVYGLVCGTSGKAGSAASCLMAAGLVTTSKVEGERGVSLSLTASGSKLKGYDKPPFVRAAKKA
jgi:hypothetical protein